jgi:hypothetical protein
VKTGNEIGFKVTIEIPSDVKIPQATAKVAINGFSDIVHPVYGYSSDAILGEGDVAIGTKDGVAIQAAFEVHGTYQEKECCWHGYSSL